MNVPPRRLVFCLVCGECLGKDKPNYGKEHTSKFSTHEKFMVMPMIDPLLLDNPDEWFKQINLKRSKIQFR